MATRIKGENLRFSVWDATAEDYLPIGCLISNDINASTNVIEAQDKCNPGVVSVDYGTNTYELSLEGYYVDSISSTGDNNVASHDYLFAKFQAKEKIDIKIDTGIADKTAYYGKVIIADAPASFPSGDDFVTFSATLRVDGDLLTVDPHA